MSKIKICDLLYVKEIKNKTNVVLMKNNIKVYASDVYFSKYYENLNNGVEVSLVAKIREHYAFYGGFENADVRLSGLIIDGIEYKILKANSTRGRWIILDLQEVK